MKFKIIVGLVMIMISMNLSAQKPGTITIEKKGLKKIYIQDNKKLSPKDLESILKSDNSSAKQFQAAKTSSIIGLTSMACGTVFIGIGFYNSVKAAQATSNNDLAGTIDYNNKSTGNLLIGAAFYVLSVPFYLMSNSHMTKSLDLYNRSHKTGNLNKATLFFGITPSGARIQLRF
jgi:hypothetical protein